MLVGLYWRLLEIRMSSQSGAYRHYSARMWPFAHFYGMLSRSIKIVMGCKSLNHQVLRKVQAVLSYIVEHPCSQGSAEFLMKFCNMVE